MKTINIEFISHNDIRIFIDNKRLEDVASFMLQIKEGGEAIYSIEKSVFPKKLEMVENKREVTKWRSIQSAVEELKEKDKNTAITTSLIKELVRKGKINCLKEDAKTRVDLNEIEKYFQNSGVREKAKPRIEVIR